MDNNNLGNVHYNRWNEDNINLDVERSQPTLTRIYYSMCTGMTGIIMKSAGGLCALVGTYLIGYVTGYYVHSC